VWVIRQPTIYQSRLQTRRHQKPLSGSVDLVLRKKSPTETTRRRRACAGFCFVWVSPFDDPPAPHNADPLLPTPEVFLLRAVVRAWKVLDKKVPLLSRKMTNAQNTQRPNTLSPLQKMELRSVHMPSTKTSSDWSDLWQSDRRHTLFRLQFRFNFLVQFGVVGVGSRESLCVLLFLFVKVWALFLHLFLFLGTPPLPLPQRLSNITRKKNQSRERPAALEEEKKKQETMKNKDEGCACGSCGPTSDVLTECSFACYVIAAASGNAKSPSFFTVQKLIDRPVLPSWRCLGYCADRAKVLSSCSYLGSCLCFVVLAFCPSDVGI
jgi:hypothetical protein